MTDINNTKCFSAPILFSVFFFLIIYVDWRMASGGGEVQWRQDCQAAGEHFFKRKLIFFKFSRLIFAGEHFLGGTELSANLVS